MGSEQGSEQGGWCFRWRRKSVFAVVAYDGLGVGHVVARWQHWHNVLYDDDTAIRSLHVANDPP
jgi:hypothetical protein